MSERGHRAQFHPELRGGWWLPPLRFTRRTVRWLRRTAPAVAPPAGVRLDEVRIGERRARVFTPEGVRGPLPVVFRIHGGGLVIGRPETDDATNGQLAQRLGVVVVSPEYRLAPEHPGPAALADLVAAYRWLAAAGAERGWDLDRVAVCGMSAGGGLAANLVAYLHDHAEEGLPRPVLQVLIYPMLDDRTTRASGPTRVWSAAANRFGWSSYLGSLGRPAVPEYAVAARRRDLSGLPPTWIGVGTLDLFHDEDLAHGARLAAAGVPTRVYVVPGAFHAFDVFWARTRVAQDFTAAWQQALREAFARP